jgi:alkylation response protein AidB-like acyl-CoA dehydrogenase
VTSPAEFGVRCREWLAANYEPTRSKRSAFTWGEGPDHVPIFEEVDRVAEADFIASVRKWRRSLWDAGFGWIAGPIEHGGRGLSGAHQQAFDQAARDFAVPGNGKLVISIGMVAPTILAHGTDGAKDRYLASLHRGDLIACQLFSEPGAGSDLASVSCRAVRDGDGWRVTGQKVWTSGAHVADVGEVLCRTGGDDRHRNLTMFMVDMKAPGLEVRPLRQMTGGAAFNEVFLDNVWIADDDRIGDVDDGWRVALTTLSHERAAVGGEGFGGVGLLRPERYIEMIKAFDLDRDPAIRDELARLVIEMRVAKLNGLRATAARRAGRAPGPEASVGKLSLADNYQRIAHLVGSVLGPRLIADTGEWGTYAWTSFVLGAPGMRIGGGTDEVLKNVLAERALGLPKT